MNTELATTSHGSTLTLHAGQEFWTEKQLAGLAQLGVAGASNGDLAVFMHVAQRTGLDPFAKQIYMIGRETNVKGEDGQWHKVIKQTIQTGIDGFRLIARRAVDASGETLSIDGGAWCGPDGVWQDVWLGTGAPAAARVIVRRGGHEFVGVAILSEYAQMKRDGTTVGQWANRPAGMLAKCAEALALRKAFPLDLSGIYSDDEMEQADVVRESATRQSPLAAAFQPVETVEGEIVADETTGEVQD